MVSVLSNIQSRKITSSEMTTYTSNIKTFFFYSGPDQSSIFIKFHNYELYE